MANNECCGRCAYLDKSGKTLWCPFHDLPTAANMVCDDFLDEYQAPLFAALATDNETGGSSKVGKYTGKDITAYVLSAMFLLLSAACFLI